MTESEYLYMEMGVMLWKLKCRGDTVGCCTYYFTPGNVSMFLSNSMYQRQDTISPKLGGSPTSKPQNPKSGRDTLEASNLWPSIFREMKGDKLRYNSCKRHAATSHRNNRQHYTPLPSPSPSPTLSHLHRQAFEIVVVFTYAPRKNVVQYVGWNGRWAGG